VVNFLNKEFYPGNMLIRKYAAKDRKAVENIHFKVGITAYSMSRNPENKKTYSKLIEYHVTKEPESCFVLENDGKVAGYLVGCLDDRNYKDVWITVKACSDFLFRYFKLNKKDRRFFYCQIRTFFTALLGITPEFRVKKPKNAGHLHMNLLPECQGKGLGSLLIKRFLKYAKSKKVKAIHADAIEASFGNNKNFWIKNGFEIYSREETRFWKDIYPKEKMYIVCYYKKL